MNRKKIILACGLSCCIGLLSGCAKTPDAPLIRQKGSASLKNYQEATEQATEGTNQTNPLRERLAAPEHSQGQFQDVSGRLQVTIDADVEIPNAEKVPAIRVSEHPLDQDIIDRMTEAFLSGAKIYTGDSYYRRTKEDCRKKLEELKGYVAQGNLDPYHYGTDDQGNLEYDIYKEIESWERIYEEAPESKSLVEIVPALDENDMFDGVAVLDDTPYLYRIKSFDGTQMDAMIQKIRYEDSYNNGWYEYSALKASEPQLPKEEELSDQIGISLEDAVRLGDEKVRQLGLEHLEMTSWEYAVNYAGGSAMGEGPSFTPENQKDAGYWLYYTRKLNNIPITYEENLGGALEEHDSVMETWEYERLNLLVTRDGIDTVQLINPYEIGEIQTENVNLLPFDEIMGIFEKMMQVQSSYLMETDGEREYQVERITFGYTRIYEPSVDSKSGILVPVWDFFGSWKGNDTYEGTVYDSSDTTKYHSFLTINGIDGSIIDRGLGY